MLKNKTLKNALPLSAALLSASVLSLLSGIALADRPAMEERSDAMHTGAEMHDEETRPAGPSSVELMMQQQTRTQQTGDVLQMPPQEIQPGQTVPVQLLDTPRRGASMDKVRRELGEPVSVSDSVGQPPITRWIYPDRIVFFEYSSVIHVVKR